MSLVDWSEAPPHATHWCPGNVRIEEGWIYNTGGEYYSCYAEKGCEHIPDFPEWRKARLVPRPTESAWTGEGLPPVGAMVEIHKNGYGIRESAEAFMGIPIEVCAVFTAGEGVAMIAVYGGIDLGCEVFRADMARPARTPEQIAAEEREKAIDQMLVDVGSTPKMETMNAVYFGALYDAGYRKQEA